MRVRLEPCRIAFSLYKSRMLSCMDCESARERRALFYLYLTEGPALLNARLTGRDFLAGLFPFRKFPFDFS